MHTTQMGLAVALWVLFAIALMTDCRGRDKARKIRRIVG